MNVVLAAVDDSAVTQTVLELARLLGELFGAEVEAVHVEDDESEHAAVALAQSLSLPFHRRRGDIATAIAAQAKERDAVAVVLATRSTSAAAAPAGHVTLDVVQALDVAVAVVPPRAIPRPITRILVAVEGDGESSALRHLVRTLRHRPEVDVVALHVFEPERLPMFGDHPVLETEAWTEEFGRRMMRAKERDVQLEVRVGDAAQSLRETATELDVDLVVIAWHRNLSRGHGRLVRSMLAKTEVPVLLLPITRHLVAESTNDVR